MNDTPRDVAVEEARRIADTDPAACAGDLRKTIHDLAAQVERLNAEIETIEADQGRKMNAMYQRAAAAEAQVKRLKAELKTADEEVQEHRGLAAAEYEHSTALEAERDRASYRRSRVATLTAERDALRDACVDLLHDLASPDRIDGDMCCMLCYASAFKGDKVEHIDGFACARLAAMVEASPTSPLPLLDQPAEDDS